MTEDLKPCPFCGGEATVEEYPGGMNVNSVCWEVGCNQFDECIADAPAIRGFALKSEAITAWNTRIDGVESSQWELIQQLNGTIETRDSQVTQILKDKDELMEELGLLADKAESLLAAATLPVPPHIHVEGLTGNLKDMQDDVRALLARLSPELEE